MIKLCERLESMTTIHKEALERYGVSEETMLRLFPYVQFNKKAVVAPTEAPIE